MNIEYKDFEKHLKNIFEVLQLQRNVDAVASNFTKNSKEEAEFRFPTLIDDTVELLEAVTNDKCNWISYWVFELDCGEKYEDGKIVSGDDGSIIKLETIEDLWNLLISYEE